VCSSDLFEPQQFANMAFSTKGSLDTILQDGRLLYLGFNAGSYNSTGSPNYVHRLAVSGCGQWQSATMTTTRYGPAGNLTTAVRGVKFQKMTLKCDFHDMLHLQADLVGKAVDLSGAVPTATASTAAPYVFAGGNMQIAGVNVLEVRSTEYTLSRVTEEQLYQSSGCSNATPMEIADLAVSHEGTIGVNMADLWKTSLFTGYSGATVMAYTGSTFNMAWRYSKGASTTDYINIIFSGCNMVSPGISGDRTGVITQQLKFKAQTVFVDVGDTLSGTNFYY
jgi:hypothetical protein